MTLKSSAPASSEPIELPIPGRLHPVLALLAFLPMMMIILIVMALTVEHSPPIPLIILLGVVLICCALLSWTALCTMLGGKLVIGPEGLTVRRLLSQTLYPWHEIDACKVTPATGTFGDDALSEAEQRVGLGLFLRNVAREREHDLDADVVICAGDKIDVQTLMRMASKVQAALKRSRNRAAQPPAQVAAPNESRNQFKKRAARPTRKAPPADPVAQFRKRAAAKS